MRRGLLSDRRDISWLAPPEAVENLGSELAAYLLQPNDEEVVEQQAVGQHHGGARVCEFSAVSLLS